MYAILSSPTWIWITQVASQTFLKRKCMYYRVRFKLPRQPEGVFISFATALLNGSNTLTGLLMNPLVRNGLDLRLCGLFEDYRQKSC